MADGGWYPDPGGRPDLYRYWDGRNWSAEVTTDPRTPPPAGGGAPGVPTSSRPGRSRGPLLLGLAVLVVIAVVVAAIGLRGSGTGTVSDPAPNPTASGWDDSSPLPTATPPPSDGTPSPTTQGRPPAGSVLCPFESNVRQTHPADGRVHGGKLSFPQVADYPGPRMDRSLSWWGDANSQTQYTEPGWISIFAVGQTRTADSGFATPQQVAESSMQCAITQGWYAYFRNRRDLVNRAVTVDGFRGWIISSEIRVDNPDISVDGDRLTFIAVDDGRDDWISVYCGMVPLGDTARIALDDRVRSQLRVG
ncbi:hypothetical protein FHX74_002063 [Friedmanniella endophytica]|uniref:DUF2510 domain-containing protein n=1 Tax=Microlunatus kandeliicorticis TaxID=1759536 RepID=A0A7W3P5Z1_9ACTN|nr:DUF2510 domain-containing protein [Microlunatus kandeliicorticis]MBA8794444.1 hypothetical protein [Microlunatus kandeliicorticis]